MATLTAEEAETIASGYDQDPANSMSLRSEAYTDPKWHTVDLEAILGRTWQWVCQVEKLTRPGSYVTTTVAEMPVVVIRDRSKRLRTS
ncbi:hypothetical protein [Streptomyces iranensis]|uniref:hypothetical protein n=1 Tax=Streptomyces iranensis TaxID=576784 RepID=UPI0039B72ACB